MSKAAAERGHAPGSVARLDWSASVPHDTRGLTLFGLGVLAVLVLGFGVWAGEAPIAGAIVTSGAFVASGQNKTIQHLEGGVIRDIEVAEGDVVEPGQVLLRLDDTNARAELKRLTLREDRLAAVEIRLEAEAGAADRVEADAGTGGTLVFPDALIEKARGDADLADVLKRQQDTFLARRDNLRSDLAVLKDGIDALEQKIRGTQQQRQSTEQQVDLYGQELDAKLYLLKGGEVRRSDVLALQRAKANGEGEIGRLDGDIGDAKERIARTREQMISARTQAVKAASEQLNDVKAEQNDVRERIRSATAVLERIDIVAPVRGIVVKLRYHTPGGVVEAGKSIMEILPVNDELLIEARIRPQDVANIRSGQKASVRLSALSQRVTPMVDGEVVYLSADALPDDKRGPGSTADQYVARIRLDPIREEALRHFVPTPGMPAEVYIKTGERTFFDYVTKPLRDSMARAFRET